MVLSKRLILVGLLQVAWLFPAALPLAAQSVPTDTPAVDTQTSPAPTPADLISMVPSDAAGVLAVNDLAAFDQKLVAKLRAAGQRPVSGITLAKGWLGIVGGVREDAPAAMLLMPAPANGTPPRAAEPPTLHPVLLVPTAQRDALLALLQPVPIADELWQVTIRQQPSFAAVRDGFTLLGPDRDVLLDAAKSNSGLTRRLTAAQRRAWPAHDLVVWLRPRVVESVLPLVDMNLPFINKMLDAAGRTNQSWLLGVNLRADDLQLELLAGQPGRDTQSAAKYALEQASRAGRINEAARADVSPWLGQPSGDIVLAIAGDGGTVATLLALLADVGLGRGESLWDGTQRLVMLENTERFFSEFEHLSVTVTATPEDADGLLNVLIVGTLGPETGAGELIYSAEAAAAWFQATQFADERATLLGQHIRFARSAHTIGQTPIHRFGLAPLEVTPPELEPWRTVWGADGPQISMAVVGDRHVVLSLAGGNERLAHAIAALEAGEAPWAAEAQALDDAAALGAGHLLRAHANVGPALRLAGRIQHALDGSSTTSTPSERPAGWLTMGVTTPAPNETAITVVLPDTLLRAR